MLKIESKPVPSKYRLRKHATVERGAPQVPYAIVVHWSAGWGELDSLWNYLRRAGADESYNFAIDRSGRCGELVSSDDAAWHAGDGKLPPLSVLDTGFVAARDVPYVKRVTNLRSVGVCLTNVGYLSASKLIEARHRGALVVEGIRHPNPRSYSRAWEGFRPAQVATFGLLLRHLKTKHPTIRMILGHEDTTNFDAMSGEGSKLDPGPAHEWDALPLAELGIVRVRYDYKRHGYAVAA